MILANIDNIEGKEHEVLGLVYGVGVPPMKMKLKTEAIGEVTEEGVERANQSMIAKAEKLEADAIVKVFYEKVVTSNMVHILVWGTAIRFK